MKKTLLLQITFTAEDEGAIIRKLRAMCKYLGRTWRVRIDTYKWLDDPPKPTVVGNVTPPYRGKTN